MTRTILVPITTKDVDGAVARAPAIAEAARVREASVIVLETDCLHGMLSDVEKGYEEMELRRIHAAAERVADAVREHGTAVETVWECVRTARRPVDAETVRRHGADAVLIPHAKRRMAILEQLELRRLRNKGIEVIEPVEERLTAGAAPGRPPSWND
jgi:hypothetical protein